VSVKRCLSSDAHLPDGSKGVTLSSAKRWGEREAEAEVSDDLESEVSEVSEDLEDEAS